MENICFKSSGPNPKNYLTHAWRYVRTRDNQADLASRGVSVAQLIDSKLWWNGPTFLEESWLKWPTLEQLDLNPPEIKPVKLVLKTMTPDNELRYSSWMRLIHRSGIIFRVYRRMRYKIKPPTNYLTVTEFKEVEERWFQIAQKKAFHVEVTELQKGKELKVKSLMLFISNGLLRVGS